MSTIEMESAVMVRMPNSVLTKSRGDGDYVQSEKLRKEVDQNLSAVSTTYSAPNNCHLCLGMTDTKYFVCNGVHYIVPLDPGIYHVTIGVNVSNVTRSRRKVGNNEA